jgi:hypothetical protein
MSYFYLEDIEKVLEFLPKMEDSNAFIKVAREIFENEQCMISLEDAISLDHKYILRNGEFSTIAYDYPTEGEIITKYDKIYKAFNVGIFTCDLVQGHLENGVFVEDAVKSEDKEQHESEYNQEIKQTTLPNSVQACEKYNQEIKQNVLPNSLPVLTFGEEYNHELKHNSLFNSLPFSTSTTGLNFAQMLVLSDSIDINFDPFDMQFVNAKHPLTEQEFDSMTEVKYAQIKDMADTKEDKCSICLTEFEDDDTLKYTECCHYFHPECLMTWTKEQHTCPLCRVLLGININNTDKQSSKECALTTK